MKRLFSTTQKPSSGISDLVQNYVSVPNRGQRLRMLIKASIGALRDPTRADLVSEVGDLSSNHALKQMHVKMLVDPIGRQILNEKPRVTSDTWNQKAMLALPEQTFGYQYAKWMEGYGYKAEERPLARYVPNPDHAYILQRYREVHDAAHVLLGYGTSVSEEIAVKWFEMMQTGLPITSLSALVGPINLLKNDRNQLKLLNTVYLPHILKNANCKFIMNVYFEKCFEMSLDDLRKEIGIVI